MFTCSSVSLLGSVMDVFMQMCLLIFVRTNGETYFNTAALVSCVQNFPKSRDTMDIKCGPLDRSLLAMQDNHISSMIWDGGDREALDVRQLTAKMGDWHILDDQRALLDARGFGVFGNPRVVPQNDIRLISALILRWRPETNTFHFPFGEMTITLEDVYMILGLPISGRALTHTELERPKNYFNANWDDPKLGKKDRKKLYKRGFHLNVLRGLYGTSLIRNCWMQHRLRQTLLQREDEIIDYAWGAAVLAYLYRGLSNAADKSAVGINGCTMLLQYWAYERLLPGRPQLAPFQDLRWPRADAWTEPVKVRRVNPHHHTRGYRGDFDSFQLHWLTWQPYIRFYEKEVTDDDVDVAYDDVDLMVACHMALGRIPMVAFEVIEYQYPDRVLRLFGMLQHIPENPFDTSFLRAGRQSSFQRPNRIVLYRGFIAEWDSYVATGMPITEEGAYVSIADYMQWFRRFPPSTPNSSQLTPSSPTRPFVYFGFGSASIHTQLRDIFDIDTNEDKLKDAEGRGGLDMRGNMTRPLKNQKIRWLYRHWWSEEGEYIWYDHRGSKNVTYQLTKEQFMTLKPGGQLEDDVVNAYCVAIFFAPSYFMLWAGFHCPPDLKVPPNEKIGIEKVEMEDFFRQYAKQHVGLDIQFCDIAFFPTCSGGHWFLFIVNLRHHKVMIIDPIRDESLCSGNQMYPQEYYIMEKSIPYMLNYLHPARFGLRYMKVYAFEDRPKQEGGVIGVYVCKYIDAMLNGIIMKSVRWDPIVNIRTFRYRIAHELKQGEARYIGDLGIVERKKGL